MFFLMLFISKGVSSVLSHLSEDWKNEFKKFLQTVPYYYLNTLKKYVF
jgi:hypothetical protein